MQMAKNPDFVCVCQRALRHDKQNNECKIKNVKIQYNSV